MNILVIGANGQLGNEMHIITKGTKDNYIFTDVVKVEGQKTKILDIANLNTIREMVKVNTKMFA
jgi:dTDP-4-dehydrorhamnose reductase